MNTHMLKDTLNIESMEKDMYDLMTRLYPICRSITGEGVRQSLNILKEHIPLTIYEVHSGTNVFDWTVPQEWNINDAYIKNSEGNKIVDFNKSNLHVLNYSIPVRRKISLEELRDHLFTNPEYPDLIPYKTSYYDENWGFCMSYNQFSELKDEEYEVFIDSSLKEGSLTYGEYVVKGETEKEVLISCHACHPSLCNDNLSGIVISAFLGKYLSEKMTKYSYRFIFIPATIGSITWLALNESRISNIDHGLVVANLGDSGNFTYKKSRQGNAVIDQAVMNVLKHSGTAHAIMDFSPYGYDERQYCSPGFNLPVGCLMRSQHGNYPEYHTSADNLDFVKPEYLYDSFLKCLAVLNILENNNRYLNKNPKCEPQLGKRGIYENIGGGNNAKARQLAILWILNLSDGNHSLLDISDRSGLKFDFIKDTADTLLNHSLLKECL